MNDLTQTPSNPVDPAADATTNKREYLPVLDRDFAEIGVPSNNPLAIFADSILETHIRPAIRLAIDDCTERRVSPSVPNLVASLNRLYCARLAEGAVRKWLKATGYSIRTQSCVVSGSAPAPQATTPADPQEVSVPSAITV